MFFHHTSKKKKKTRVHSILRTRQEQGQFHLLMKKLRHSPNSFRVYFRMSVVQFDTLLILLELHTKKKNTSFCESVNPEQLLAVCSRPGHTNTHTHLIVLSEKCALVSPGSADI